MLPSTGLSAPEASTDHEAHHAEGNIAAPADISEFDLEALLNQQVVTVSKKSERVGDMPASIYVLTRADIRRMAVTRLQELFNWMPGMWVTDLAYNESQLAVREAALPHALTARVLLDGVPITSAMTSGLPLTLSDLDVDRIERIELVKGPAGTIYGTNAATGVIAIYTRPASDGVQATLEGGTRGHLAPRLQLGVELGRGMRLELYAKHKRHEGYEPLAEFAGQTVRVPVPTGEGTTTASNRFVEPTDSQKITTGGLRFDAELDETASVSGWIDASYGTGRQYGRRGQYFDTDLNEVRLSSVWAYRVLGSVRVDKRWSDAHHGFLQLSADEHAARIAVGGGLRYRARVIRAELHDSLRVTDALEVTAGATTSAVSYRASEPKPWRQLALKSRTTPEYRVGAFVQATLRPQRSLRLTAGVRSEIWTLVTDRLRQSPFARVAWSPSDTATFWVAGSRALTSPGFLQTDIEYRLVEVAPDVWAGIIPTDDVRPTEYTTVELGGRTLLSDWLTAEVAAYCTWARGRVWMGGFEWGELVHSIADPDATMLPGRYGNTDNARFYGGEAVLTGRIFAHAQAQLSYTLLQVERTWSRFQNDGALIPWAHPKHVVRGRVYVDSSWGTRVTLAGIYNSNAASRYSFDYLAQAPALDSPPGVVIDDGPAHLQIDFKVEHTFSDRGISVFVWGADVLNSGIVEAYSPWNFTPIPHGSHRLFGAGLSYVPQASR